MVSGGLPTIMGIIEDATDDGTAAEVDTLTMDDLTFSELRVVIEEVGVV